MRNTDKPGFAILAAVVLSSAPVSMAQTLSALIGLPLSATDGTAANLPAVYSSLVIGSTELVYAQNGHAAGVMAGAITGSIDNGSVVYSAWEYTPGSNNSVGATNVVGYYTSATNGSRSDPYVTGINDSGQVIGYSPHYNSGYNTSAGFDAWVSTPGAGSVTLGLTGSGVSYTSSAGNQTIAYPNFLNAAGVVIGTNARYQDSTSVGTASWIYTPPTGSGVGTNTETGLNSLPAAAFNSSLTSAASYAGNAENYNLSGSTKFQYVNTNVALSTTGYAVGFATSYLLTNSGSSAYTNGGQDGWLYSPGSNGSAGTTTPVGLIQSGLTALNYQGTQYIYGGLVSNSYGLKRNTAILGVSKAGQVLGWSTYYDPNTGLNTGTDAFLYTPPTGTVQANYQLLGFTSDGINNGTTLNSSNVNNWVNPSTGAALPAVSIGYVGSGALAGRRGSIAIAMNDAGQSTGYSTRYTGNGLVTTANPGGGPSGDGQDAWFASQSGVVMRIGLTDQNGSAYVERAPIPSSTVVAGQYALGGELSQPTQITQSGLVGGYSKRFYYSAGSSDSPGTIGWESWVYDSTTGQTFTVSDLPILYGVDPATNTTQTDYNTITYLGENGNVLGLYGQNSPTLPFFWSPASGFIPLAGYAPANNALTKLLSVNSDASVIYAQVQNGTTNAMNIAQISVSSLWANPESGSFNTGSNWASGNVPGSDTSNPLVVLGAAITTPSTVSLDSSATVGSLTFSNPNAYTLSSNNASILTINGVNIGALIVTAGSHFITAPVSFQSPTDVTLSAGTSLELDGAISGSGNLQIGGGGFAGFGNGTLTIGGDSSGYSGGINIGSGALVIKGNSAATGLTTRSFVSLTVNAGALLKLATPADSAHRQAIVAGALSLAGTTGAYTGSVDLTSNDLVVQNGNLAQITAAVKQGYNNGNWQGSGGITSFSAATNKIHLTALGVIQNSVDGTISGSTLYGSFDGVSGGASSDVLIKYTYYGDANVDGKVDGSDYTRIDAGYLAHGSLTGWFNGDFNYDGVINGSDYTLIDNAFNTQGATLASQLAVTTSQIGSNQTAVPEPTALTLIVMGGGLLGRRRRSRC